MENVIGQLLTCVKDSLLLQFLLPDIHFIFPSLFALPALYPIAVLFVKEISATKSLRQTTDYTDSTVF
jgi:hypothetical protein